TTSRRFSKGYFGFDILGAIPFHRPTKWVQYRLIEISPGAFVHLEPRECLTPDSLKHPTPFYT
ncbi:hypothetical protein, partial [Escherichia coli]